MVAFYLLWFTSSCQPFYHRSHPSLKNQTSKWTLKTYHVDILKQYMICHWFLTTMLRYYQKKINCSYLGMLCNYWKTLLSITIGKTNFPSKHTLMQWHGYPIYLFKNHPVNIVISSRYCLFTYARRATGRRFLYRQLVTELVETLTFTDFKRENKAFPSLSPPCNVNCCSSYL